jgi:hypothetical protein
MEHDSVIESMLVDQARDDVVHSRDLGEEFNRERRERLAQCTAEEQWQWRADRRTERLNALGHAVTLVAPKFSRVLSDASGETAAVLKTAELFAAWLSGA